MGHLESLRKNWNGLAAEDALWAVLADPSRRDHGWTPDEFLQVGMREVSTVFEYLADRGLRPEPSEEALDFGCGAGRLTRALAARFSAAHGVDISDEMISSARDLNAHVAKCHFYLNVANDLRLFNSARFGFVYSNIVLQHMKPDLASRYITEFVRVLKHGGIAVFQVPDRNHSVRRPKLNILRQKAALRSRVTRLLREHDISASAGYVMEMHGLPEADVKALVTLAGGTLQDVAFTNACAPDFAGHLIYLDRAPSSDWLVSKQYSVVRT